ncbi:MFS transporter [Lysinibacillus xylanilyticus]|uniref:MFS transporter n=1 Tax=Lysinibacillus xylanilyticus TaxID=582475 RepID=UPI003D07C2A4
MKKITKSELTSEFLTNVGDMLFYPALIAYALFFEKSALFLALIAASEHLPSILAPVYGYWVDKINRKIKALMIIGVIQAFLFIIVAFIINDVSVFVFYLLIIINFISGSLNRSYNATSMSLVLNELNEEEEIKKYRSMSISIRTIVMILGQLLGAALLLYISASFLAVINAITFLLPILLILKFLKYYKKTEETLKLKKEGLEDQNPFGVFAEITQNKTLTQLLFLVGMINFVVIPLSTVFIPETLKNLIRIEEHQIPMFFAITIAVFGIATIVGITLAQMIKFDSNKIISTLVKLIFLVGVYILITSFVQSYYQLAVISFAYGLTIGIFNVYAESYFYSNVPVEKIAIYNGVMQSITLGAGVISSLLAGMLIIKVGVHYTFISYGMFLIMLGILGIGMIHRKAREIKKTC